VRAEVAIVGNGVAGTACAMRLARHGIRPLLVGPGLPVDRPPLTKSALVKGEPVLLADEERLVERGVERLDATADEIDLAGRRLEAGNEDVEAGAIVLATGLSYRPPRIPGLDAAHVNATPGGMRRLAAALAGGPRRVAVIGGGLIGVETAATLATQGHAVTVLDLLERPRERLHEPLPAIASATLEELGVAFVGGASVEQLVTAGDHLVTISYEQGGVEADVVVAATGGRLVAPPGLAVEGPLEVGADMAVPGLVGVHACGDLVLVPHARFGPIRFPHWDAAIGTGEQAADAIAGRAGPYERLPYWWSDIGPRRLAEVGWSGAVETWAEEDGLYVGRDAAGAAVCALVVDAPRRLREARALVQGGGA
jgi:3-phenylpropionate/trans-cinnamate dioxygenase ferredoxin reductase component